MSFSSLVTPLFRLTYSKLPVMWILSSLLNHTYSEIAQQCPQPLSSDQHDLQRARSQEQILDITLGLGPETLHWDSPLGLGDFRSRYSKIEEGDLSNQSKLKEFPVHVATHVDAPSHFVHEEYKAGKGVEQLDIHVLVGGVLVVEIPKGTNISADALANLSIPEGVERIIFKTENTERKLMHQKAFQTDYVAFTKDGAEYIVDQTDVKLVGVDYTSVAIYEDLAGAHNVLLPNVRKPNLPWKILK